MAKIKKVRHYIIAKTRKPRARHPSRPHAKNTALVLVGNGLGNVIEQTPLIAATASLFKHVDVWLPRSHAYAAEPLRDWDKIRRIYVGEKGPSRRHRYDAALSTWMMDPFLVRIRAGRKFTGAVPDDRQHETEITMLAARRAGYHGETPHLHCSEQPWPDKIPTGAPLIALSSGSNTTAPWQLKRYQKFARVLSLLQLRYPELRVLHIGRTEDDPVTHPSLIDLRDQGTVRQIAGLIRQCRLFIGNDCGWGHVARAVGTPAVLVFGPTSVAKNLPAGAIHVQRKLSCSPCQFGQKGIGFYRNGEPCRNECLGELAAADIANAVLDQLAGDDLVQNP
jgi:hypothetical protein